MKRFAEGLTWGKASPALLVVGLLVGFTVSSIVPSGAVSDPCGPYGSYGQYGGYQGGCLPNLKTTKNDAKDPVTRGQQIEYDISVSNLQGGGETTNVEVTDQLPTQVTYVSAIAGGGQCTYNSGSRTVTCTFDHADPGDFLPITIKVTASHTGTPNNEACATSDFPDANPSDNCDTETTTINPSPGGGGGEPQPSPTPSPTPTPTTSPSPTASSSAPESPSPSPSAPGESPSPTEKPACSDGVDNDGDGQIDFPADKGCSSASDDTETRTVRVSSRVTIEQLPRGFGGHVHNSRLRCRVNRTVVLFRRDPGPDTSLGSSPTGPHAFWQIDSDLQNGAFYAVAPRKDFTNAIGDHIICLRGVSDLLHL